MHADIQLGILAKAPLPGQAKTRLIPGVGAQRAARIHADLVRHSVATACQAFAGSHITLWTALDHAHPLFIELQEQYAISLAPQPEGDLGARMLHALGCAPGPTLLMGSDCPLISPALLQHCSQALADHDVVILPAEDGGYGLIGMNHPQPELFREIAWGSAQVMAMTRQRIQQLGLSLACPATLWDIDHPEDWSRWQALNVPLL